MDYKTNQSQHKPNAAGVVLGGGSAAHAEGRHRDTIGASMRTGGAGPGISATSIGTTYAKGDSILGSPGDSITAAGTTIFNGCRAAFSACLASIANRNSVMNYYRSITL